MRRRVRGLVVGAAVFAGSACSAFGGSQDAANVGPDAAASDGGIDRGDAADARPCPACNSGYCTIAGKCDPLVFVSAEHHDGNLGGASGADEMCARAATDAGFTSPTSFLAWVTTDPSVSARIVLVPRPYRRVNGDLVANGGADFADGGLAAPIAYDEHGGPADPLVWTNVTPTGNAIGSNCLGWTRTDMASDGTTGSSLQTGPAWTGSSSDTCDKHHPVYCFEVIP